MSDKKIIVSVIFIALLFSAIFALTLRQAPVGRPDIRIISRQYFSTIDGREIYELQWSVNGANQLPADFTLEVERDRYEGYLHTVGRVSE